MYEGRGIVVDSYGAKKENLTLSTINIVTILANSSIILEVIIIIIMVHFPKTGHIIIALVQCISRVDTPHMHACYYYVCCMQDNQCFFYKIMHLMKIRIDCAC